MPQVEVREAREPQVKLTAAISPLKKQGFSTPIFNEMNQSSDSQPKKFSRGENLCEFLGRGNKILLENRSFWGGNLQFHKNASSAKS